MYKEIEKKYSHKVDAIENEIKETEAHLNHLKKERSNLYQEIFSYASRS